MNWLSFAAGAVVCGGLVTFATPARASGPALGADVDVAIGGQGPVIGGDLGVRAGYRFDVGSGWITPEAAFDVTLFPGVAPSIRATGGGRFGLALGKLEPWLAVHFGYGWLGHGFVLDASSSSATQGFTLDGGLGLNIRIHEHVAIGAHALYTHVFTTDSIGWFRPGVNVDVLF